MGNCRSRGTQPQSQYATPTPKTHAMTTLPPTTSCSKHAIITTSADQLAEVPVLWAFVGDKLVSAIEEPCGKHLSTIDGYCVLKDSVTVFRDGNLPVHWSTIRHLEGNSFTQALSCTGNKQVIKTFYRNDTKPVAGVLESPLPLTASVQPNDTTAVGIGCRVFVNLYIRHNRTDDGFETIHSGTRPCLVLAVSHNSVEVVTRLSHKHYARFTLDHHPIVWPNRCGIHVAMAVEFKCEENLPFPQYSTNIFLVTKVDDEYVWLQLTPSRIHKVKRDAVRPLTVSLSHCCDPSSWEQYNR